MIYKQPSIYKMGGNDKYTFKEYDYTPLTKYASYFSPHLKNLKSCSNGILQLSGSIKVINGFTPHYEPSDGEHSSSSWPLVFYFENVDYLENESNQSTLFFHSSTPHNIDTIIAVIEIVPSDRKVYVRFNASYAIYPEYYHLMGTFIT